MRGEVGVSDSRVFSASAQAVWDVISRVDLAPQWSGAVESVVITSSGDFGAGSHFTEEASLLGKAIKTRKRVTLFDAPTHYSETTESGLFAHSIDITLEAEGDSTTRVTLGIRGEIPRVFRLVKGLLERTLRHQIATDLEALQRYVESGAR